MLLVSTPEQLRRTANELSGASTFFLDTEFESTREARTLCLLQVSAGDEIYLVDTLALQDLSPLSQVLGAPDAEWVLHAGQQDVLLLERHLDLNKIPRLFDTQIAWGLCSPEPSVSLSYLLFRVLEIRTGKSHQADDWKRRPLPAPQLAYAAGDIEHLPEVRRLLGEQLRDLKRETIVWDASADLLIASDDPPPPLRLDSFRNAWQLGQENQAVLRALIEWYNDLDDRARDAAPPAKVLLSIANRMPESPRDLSRIKGVPARFGQRHANELAGLVRRAISNADGSGFVPIDPPPYAAFHDIRVDAYLATARAEICHRLTAAPELVMPTRVMRRVRDALTASPEPSAQPEAIQEALNQLDGWRGELLTPAFRDFFAAHPPPTP